MSKLSITHKGSGLYEIEGELTFSSIDKQTIKSASFLAKGKDVTIDLGRVSGSDSAGLALMIEWLRQARAKRVHVQFKNIPKQLIMLAKLSGFDKTNQFNLQSD